MRQFIRHPTEIPIEVSADQMGHTTLHVRNLSLGGLSFQCDLELQLGTLVDVRIPFVQPTFETKARVAWCSAREAGFEMGVEFLSAEDAYRGRMVEQVCHIENYKQAVYQSEGRPLTVEEAAHEWISKHAAQFPDPGPEHNQ